ncbi:unnamed protein product, partial [Didymodactylos carnosus]
MSNDSDPSKQHFMECPYYQPETSPVSSPESTSPVSSPESIIILSNDAMHKQQRFEAQQVIQLHELPTTSIKRSSTSDTQRSNNNAPDIPSCDALSDRKRKHRNVEYALGLQPPTVIEPPLGARTPVVVSQQDRVGLQEKGPVYTVPQAKSTINFNIVEFNNDDFFTSSVKKPKNNTTKKKTPTQYNPDDIKKQQPLEAQQLIQLLQLPTVSIKRSPMSYAQRSYNNLHDTRSCDVLSNSKHDRKNVDRALRLQLPVVTEPTSGARPPVIVTLQDRVRTQDTDMIYGVPQSKSTITFQDPVRHQEQDPLYAFFQSDPTITSTTPDIDNEVLNWNEFEILLSNTTPEISAQSMLASKASKSVNRSKNRPRTKNPPIRYNTDGIHKQQRLEAQQVIQLLELPTTCIERSGESEDKLTDNNLSDTRSNDVLSDCKRKGRNFERVLGPQPPTIAEPSFDARTPVVISFQYPLGPEDTHAICEVPQSKSGITFTIPDFYNDCFNWAEIDDILSATIRGVSDHKQQLLEAQKVIQPPELPTISIERSYTTDNKRFDGDVPDTRSCDVLSDCTDERINLGSALGSQATRVVEPPLRTPTPVVISLQYPVRPEDIYPIYGVPQAESTISSTIFDFGNNDLNWDKIDHILPGTVPEVWAQSMLTSKVSKSVKKSGNSSVKKKARIQCNLGDIQKQQRLEAQEVTQPPELPTTSIERSSPSNNNKRADNNVPDTPSCAVLSHSDDERINIERALGPQALRVAEPLLETPTPVVVPLQYPVRSEDTYPIYRVPQPESTISFTTPGFGKNDFNWDEIDHILSTTIPEVWAQSVLTSEVSESVRKSNNTSMKEKPSSRYNPDDIHRQQRLVAREITEPPELPTISIGRSCTSDDKRTKHDGLDTRSCDVLLDCKDKRINDERALGAQPPAVTELSFGGCPLVAVSLQYPEGPECTYPLYRVPESKSEITFTIPDSGNDDVNCGKIHDMRSSTIPEVSAESMLRSQLSKSGKESRKDKLPIRYNADDIHRQQRLVDQEIMQPPELPTTSIERASASSGKGTDNNVPDTRSYDVLSDCKDKRINAELALGPQVPPVTGSPFGARPPVVITLHDPVRTQDADAMYAVRQSKSTITFTMPDIDDENLNWDEVEDILSNAIPEISAQWMLTSKVSKSVKRSKNRLTKNKTPIGYNPGDINRQQRLEAQEVIQPPELLTICIERSFTSDNKRTEDDVRDTRSYNVLSDCEDERTNVDRAGPQPSAVTEPTSGARPPVVVTLQDRVRAQDTDAIYGVPQSKSTITFTISDFGNADLNSNESDIRSSTMPGVSAQSMLTSDVMKSVRKSNSTSIKEKSRIRCKRDEIQKPQRLEAEEVIEPPELPTSSIEILSVLDDKRTDNNVPDTPSCNVLSNCKDKRIDVELALGPQPPPV